MKKNETAEAEEKKLIWKFKDLPTASEVAQLVEQEVITPTEGREILFKEQNKADEVEALKEMVDELKQMVRDLVARPPTYTKVIEVPARSVPYWNKVMLGGGTLGGTITTATGSNGSAVYTMSVKE